MANSNIETVNDRVESTNGETTGKRYAGTIRVWVKWCNQEDRDPFAATSLDIEDYLSDLYEEQDYSYSTVNVHLAAISSFFKAADTLSKKGRPIPSPREESPLATSRWENPADDAKLANVVTEKKDRKNTKKERALEEIDRRHGLDEDQISRLFESAPSPTLRNQAILQIAYEGMLRRTEVVHLKVEDIDLETKEIHIRSEVAKNGEERYTYWSTGGLTTQLRAWINVDRESYALAPESEYLFLSNEKEHLSPFYTGDIFRQASMDADIGQDVLYTDARGHEKLIYSFHSLRHAGAVRRWKNDCDLRTLQKLLGHESLATTEMYLDVSDEALAEKAKGSW